MESVNANFAQKIEKFLDFPTSGGTKNLKLISWYNPNLKFSFVGSSIKSIKIPKNIKAIDPMVLGYCEKLQHIEVDSGNTVFDSRNNCNAIINTANNVIVAGCGSTVIPNDVTGIADYAFAGTPIESLNIPSSVTYIGQYVFSTCACLSSLTVDVNNPNYYSRGNIIYDKSSDEMVTYGSSIVAPEGAYFGVDSWGGMSSHSLLTSVTFESGVTYIDYNTFQCQSLLSTVTIHSGITSISDYAFSGCPLVDIYIDGAPTMGTDVFETETSGFTINVKWQNYITILNDSTWQPYLAYVQVDSEEHFQYRWVEYGETNVNGYIHKRLKEQVSVDGTTWANTGQYRISDESYGVWDDSHYVNEYLLFETTQSGTFKFSGATSANTLEYSLDNGETWTTLAHNTNTPTIAAGGNILWKGEGLTINTSSGIGKYISTGAFNVKGNIMSLHFGDNFLGQTSLNGKDNAYRYLFSGCTKIVSAENLSLPATTLATSCYYGMFYSCSGLTAAPVLSVTTLANSCYSYMFASCSGLTTAPILPATTLVYGCYSYMFLGCTSLTTTPALPATTLAGSCYRSMFSGCRSLTTAPTTLPATGLTDYCYDTMFQNCTSLTTAPSLPATTLTDRCYFCMFQGCSGLTSAPELPATTLASRCYYAMFQGCSGLTSAPELPATTLTYECYRSMFASCANLSYIKASFTTTPSSTYTSNWVNGVAASGTFVKNGAAMWNVWGFIGVPVGWTVEYSYKEFIPNISLTPQEYVTFTATANNSGLGINTKSSGQTIYFSKNTTLWQEVNAGDAFAMNSGDSFYVCGILSSNNSDSNYTRFSMNGAISASGNTNAIWNYNDTTLQLKMYCGYGMFSGCTALTTAPELPATTLSEGCYQNMFRGCINLITTTELPATSLTSTNLCYSEMFLGCSNLTTIAPIRAKSLSGRACNHMFDSCTSLATAPLFEPTYLSEYACNGMFESCSNLTDVSNINLSNAYIAGACTMSYMFNNCTSLTSAPNLPDSTPNTSGYTYMFAGCTSLTTAPILPATAVSQSCYSFMFSGCTSLTTAPALPATTLSTYCYNRMFAGCTSLTTVPTTLPATTLQNYCYQYMFSGCTSLTAAPVLPATTLKNSCYNGMFDGCANLSYIKAMFTTTPSSTYTSNWVKDVASTGTYVKNSAASYTTRGVYAIPNGWTLETASS